MWVARQQKRPIEEHSNRPRLYRIVKLQKQILSFYLWKRLAPDFQISGANIVGARPNQTIIRQLL